MGGLNRFYDASKPKYSAIFIQVITSNICVFVSKLISSRYHVRIKMQEYDLSV